MASKKWLWVVIAGLVIVTIQQIMTLPKGDLAESRLQQVEQAPGSDGQTTHVASLGELPGMSPGKKQPVTKPAEAEDSPTFSQKEQEQEAVDAVERAETRKPVEYGQVKQLSLPAIDEPAPEMARTPPPVAPVTASLAKGLVRGVVYGEEGGSALIDETIVQTGGVIDGVRVLRIHADGVDFEKDGRTWTQKIGESPEKQWR